LKPPPLGKFWVSNSYFTLRILPFETPLPRGISINLSWGGPYGYFMELHILGRFHRVPTGHGKPGKSWNLLQFSITRSGKSWNLSASHGK